MQFDVWNVVFLVILGPLFEEWIFRKELISRTRKYGEKPRLCSPRCSLAWCT